MFYSYQNTDILVSEYLRIFDHSGLIEVHVFGSGAVV